MNKVMQKTNDFAKKYDKEMVASLKTMKKNHEVSDDVADNLIKMV
jgi:hypothetical protein